MLLIEEAIYHITNLKEIRKVIDKFSFYIPFHLKFAKDLYFTT